MAWHRSLWFLVYQSLICHVLINHRIILVLVTGGRDYIQPSRRQYVLGIQAVYIYTANLMVVICYLSPFTTWKNPFEASCAKRNIPNATNFDVFPNVDVVWYWEKTWKKHIIFVVHKPDSFWSTNPQRCSTIASTEHVRYVNLFKPLFTYIHSVTLLNSTWMKRKNTNIYIYMVYQCSIHIYNTNDHMIYIYMLFHTFLWCSMTQFSPQKKRCPFLSWSLITSLFRGVRTEGAARGSQQIRSLQGNSRYGGW